jgi:DNA-binding response OmpR family regulator
MKKNKVLIVEDDRDTSFLLNKLLTKHGYEVLSSKNGEEAIVILKTVTPQVIVADWTMPIMDGLQLCKLLKKDDKYKSIYFIMLTARATLADRVLGFDIGADDFIVKPIENQELLARIKSGIRIHDLQTELKSIEHQKAILEMACTIGHQINNPLSSLIISLQNVKLELSSDEHNDDIDIIEKSIERIKNLVNDLIHLQNPELIDYTPDKKMIRLKSES